MDRAQKPIVVEELNRVFNEVNVVVVTRNLGLSVAQSTALRLKMREAGATFKVTKNSLAKIATKGTVYESIGDLLTGVDVVRIELQHALVELERTARIVDLDPCYEGLDHVKNG